MTSAPALRRERRSQETRREEMKARLLEATLLTILDDGWAQASTQKICMRAGVSRGAQTHHYPTKTELLLAAIRQIVRRYQEVLDEGAHNLDTQSDAFEDYLTLLWDGSQQAGFLQSWMEALVAARTDSTLRTKVREIDHTAIDAMRAHGERVAPDGADPKLAADLTELTAYLLRGMTVQDGVHTNKAETQRLFELWRDILASAMDSRPASGPDSANQ